MSDSDAPRPGGAGGGGPARRSPAADERPEPVVDPRSDDDRDLGWGDDADRAERGGRGGRDARWYEEQRPPHWE